MVALENASLRADSEPIAMRSLIILICHYSNVLSAIIKFDDFVLKNSLQIIFVPICLEGLTFVELLLDLAICLVEELKGLESLVDFYLPLRLTFGIINLAFDFRIFIFPFLSELFLEFCGHGKSFRVSFEFLVFLF